MKAYKWGFNEDKWSDEKIVAEIKRLESEVVRLNEMGPQEEELHEIPRQALLNLMIPGIQHLRALRAEKLKNKIAKKK